MCDALVCSKGKAETKKGLQKISGDFIRHLTNGEQSARIERAGQQIADDHDKQKSLYAGCWNEEKDHGNSRERIKNIITQKRQLLI